ncbi:hypothetical protein [Caproiciproducens sp.]
MKREDMRLFLDKSGLKQKTIAEQTNIENWIFTKWINEQTTLTSSQMERLDDFVSVFYHNNAYVQS